MEQTRFFCRYIVVSNTWYLVYTINITIEIITMIILVIITTDRFTVDGQHIPYIYRADNVVVVFILAMCMSSTYNKLWAGNISLLSVWYLVLCNR